MNWLIDWLYLRLTAACQAGSYGWLIDWFITAYEKEKLFIELRSEPRRNRIWFLIFWGRLCNPKKTGFFSQRFIRFKRFISTIDRADYRNPCSTNQTIKRHLAQLVSLIFSSSIRIEGLKFAAVMVQWYFPHCFRVFEKEEHIQGIFPCNLWGIPHCAHNYVVTFAPFAPCPVKSEMYNPMGTRQTLRILYKLQEFCFYFNCPVRVVRNRRNIWYTFHLLLFNPAHRK